MNVFKARSRQNATPADSAFFVKKECFCLDFKALLATRLFERIVERLKQLRHAAILARRSNSHTYAPRRLLQPRFELRTFGFGPLDCRENTFGKNFVEVDTSAAHRFRFDVFNERILGFGRLVFGHEEGTEAHAGIAAALNALHLVDHQNVDTGFFSSKSCGDARQTRSDNEYIGFRLLGRRPRRIGMGGCRGSHCACGERTGKKCAARKKHFSTSFGIRCLPSDPF